MATGEHTHDDAGHGGEIAVPDQGDLPEGTVVTSSGRVSAAESYSEHKRVAGPFTPVQLSRIDEAMMLAGRSTGLRFTVYVGDLGNDPSATVGDLHAGIEGAAEAVLIAVSPGQRFVEVLTGHEARLRLPDRSSKLAVMSMLASFREADIFGGLLSGLRMLADQAGRDVGATHPVTIRETVPA